MVQPLFLQITDKIAELQDVLEDHLALSSSYSADTDKDEIDDLTTALVSLQNAFIKLRAALVEEASSTNGKDVQQFNSLVAKHEKLIGSLISGYSLDEATKKDLAKFKFPSTFKIIVSSTPKSSPARPYRDNVEESSDSAVVREGEEDGLGKGIDTVIDDTRQNKSVRFKQNLIESSPPKLFKPYRDNIDAELDLQSDDLYNNNKSESNPSGYKDTLFETMNPDTSELDNPPIDLSNKQIFIHNQQQFVHQDDRLDELHNSIKQQREISMHINRETSSQFVLLNDLERGIESSNSRLIRSNNKLQQYREALKKRGDWMCIIILTFVLLVLLVILK